MRWQITIALVYILALFVFVSLYTGQWPRKSWITVVTLISALLLIANFLSSYSLRFTSLDQTAQVHLPWGETLTRFYGTFGVGNALGRVFYTGVLIWAIWRTIIQYRLGAHRAALYLGTTIVILLLASIWGLLIDLGIINTIYITGFAFLALTLLMNIYMSSDFREQNEKLETATSALRNEIEQRKKIEQLVKQCAAGISSFTGMAFLQKLVEQLAGIFNAEYAFIGQLNERDAGVINTLAVWAHGQLADNMTYALAHTPCANVVNARTCVYPQGVRDQFPRDKLLVEMGVDSYIGSPLFDVNGRPMGLVVVLDRKPLQDTAIIIDILEIFSGRAATEIQRMQTEEALHTAEEKLRATIEYTPNVAIQWYDQNGRVLYWNPASETMYGWRKEEAVGKTLDQLIHTPEEMAVFIATCKEIQRTGKPTKPTEYTFKRRDGSLGTCISTIFALPEDKGQTFFVCMDFDITKRCQVEEQLRQAQKLDAIGRLTGGIAHDFNNLLTAIIGFSDLCLQTQELDTTNRDYINEVKNAGMRAADLTHQLLAFSRKQVIAPVILDLNEVVSGMEKMLRRLIMENIRLVLKLDPSLKRVNADASQIEQIVMNLVINARDAMPDGGQLIIETSNGEHDHHYVLTHPEVKPGPYVMLAISDTGTGISQEDQSRIFEPFFTTKEKGKGTGLGLATVYGIVKQSGGFIYLYSEPGIGTTFRIYLPPAEAAESLPDTLLETRQLQSKHHETILLVEDETSVRSLAHMILKSCGYQILEARNGDEALRLCEEHPGPIHLLVSDVIMPGMNGRKLASQLLPRYPGLQVLYISGYTDEVITRNGILTEGTVFLSKPFTSEMLASKVHEVLYQV